METEKSQKELFEFEAPRKTAPRFNNIFHKADFGVALSPERMVFVSIGIIMLMVVFFALGVEKGKSIAMRKAAVRKAPVAAIQPIAVQAPVKLAPASVAPLKAAPVPTNITPKNTTAFDKAKPYTIVTAAFSRQEFASQEVGKLRSGGLEAVVYYNNPYYLACVGSFANKESAQKMLVKVKQMRRDAYVRLR